jgi:hypothetical protein
MGEKNGSALQQLGCTFHGKKLTDSVGSEKIYEIDPRTVSFIETIF